MPTRTFYPLSSYICTLLRAGRTLIKIDRYLIHANPNRIKH